MFTIKSPVRVIGFWMALLALVVAFRQTLAALLVFAIHSDLESHILMVPFISGYLFFLRRKDVPAVAGSAVIPGVIILSMSLGLIGLYTWTACLGVRGGEYGLLFFPVLSFVVFVIGLYVSFFGAESFRHSAFPLLFLFVMVPLPDFVVHRMATSLQRWSADASHVMFLLTGTPFFRDGMLFRLPGLTIEVAEECSGIHSSLVLFITSMLAGHLFLKKPWSKAILVAAVLPLGIIRNGFRVVLISLLTIHVDPEIIKGPLHRKGGPIFFALSLVIFLVLLGFLRWNELRRGRRPQTAE